MSQIARSYLGYRRRPVNNIGHPCFQADLTETNQTTVCINVVSDRLPLNAFTPKDAGHIVSSNRRSLDDDDVAETAAAAAIDDIAAARARVIRSEAATIWTATVPFPAPSEVVGTMPGLKAAEPNAKGSRIPPTFTFRYRY